MRIKRVSSDVGDKIASKAIWLLGLGVLLTIWGSVWMVYLYRNHPDHELTFFLALGTLLTGLDLGLIGMRTGRIGRAARDPAEQRVNDPKSVAVASTPTRHKD